MKTRLVWIGTFCLLAALLGSAPAWSQNGFERFEGLYTRTEGEAGPESLVRLEFVPVPDPVYGSLIATVFGSDGRYRVFAGPILPSGGGFRFPILILHEARRPYRFLKNPRLLLEDQERHLRLDVQCQIQLMTGETLDYTCFDRDDESYSSGRLVRIRG